LQERGSHQPPKAVEPTVSEMPAERAA
jgi:hypothetical protein